MARGGLVFDKLNGGRTLAYFDFRSEGIDSIGFLQTGQTTRQRRRGTRRVQWDDVLENIILHEFQPSDCDSWDEKNQILEDIVVEEK